VVKYKGIELDQCEVDIPEPLVTLSTLAYLSAAMVLQFCRFVVTRFNRTFKLSARRVKKEN